jgi:hypothetical protein
MNEWMQFLCIFVSHVVRHHVFRTEENSLIPLPQLCVIPWNETGYLPQFMSCDYPDILVPLLTTATNVSITYTTYRIGIKIIWKLFRHFTHKIVIKHDFKCSVYYILLYAVLMSAVGTLSWITDTIKPLLYVYVTSGSKLKSSYVLPTQYNCVRLTVHLELYE